ncbi:HipA N-terminal domain-containing protein [Niabella hibiscisoli]|uniref:HipA N-terminal domain-containing protein n=1 Tax=Niabella hibiscisoli TaxID=1825928 RepID=UPI001F118B29|nr:HipA N-terminal domain-containing protein [Niabella hibiscisoli]MCH5719208.1 HipA N-terminal domain-containing protein [Niabella hibiscisoli]
MRRAIVKYGDIDAGILEETDEGIYMFTYNEDYVRKYPKQFITFQMPVNKFTYQSKKLFAFFDGLIPEGWLLNITSETWRIKTNDRMGLLLAVGKNCIGAVSVHDLNVDPNE